MRGCSSDFPYGCFQIPSPPLPPPPPNPPYPMNPVAPVPLATPLVQSAPAPLHDFAFARNVTTDTGSAAATSPQSVAVFGSAFVGATGLNFPAYASSTSSGIVPSAPYACLPSLRLGGTDVTLTTWFTTPFFSSFMRVFDFGVGSSSASCASDNPSTGYTQYSFLTFSAGGSMPYFECQMPPPPVGPFSTFTSSSSSTDSSATSSGFSFPQNLSTQVYGSGVILSTNAWTHLAVTVSMTGPTSVYVNGATPIRMHKQYYL